MNHNTEEYQIEFANLVLEFYAEKKVKDQGFTFGKREFNKLIKYDIQEKSVIGKNKKT